MNEWFAKLFEKIKGTWAKWSLVQKLIFIGIGLAAIAGIIILIAVSAAPTMTALIKTPIKTDEELRRITAALDSEQIKYDVAANNTIMVADEKVRQRANAILIREDLIPKGTDPWAIFDIDRWTITDFERNVNLRRAITQQVINHIEAIADIDNANVTIVMPEKELFQEDQNPVTASVIISPKPGSTIVQDRKKLEGIQKIVKLAVEGLKEENIVITDQNGIILNDFASLADYDRLEQTKREQKLIASLEAKCRADVLRALQQTFTQDRVRDLNVKIDMDMSKKNVKTEEFFPFEMKPDNPRTPYDDSDYRASITRSKTSTTYDYQGTAFNPEGPAGVEGQTAPAYKDLQNMNGKATQTTVIQNEEINKRNIDEERSPTIERLTVSVNIDGKWNWKYNEKGQVQLAKDGSIERLYTPVPADEISQAAALVRDAVGYDRDRGDSVTVQNIQFDRSAQFKVEDKAYIRQRQTEQTILYTLIGLAGLLLVFIVVRLVSREMERRKRIKEEEMARQHQMMRESALRQAEEEGVEVSMSVEERKRLEMQESAIAMAKDHPEDVAQLIRTWLIEE